MKHTFIKNLENLGASPQLLITVVQLPSGALEVIQNTQHIGNKIQYLIDAYDDDFCLKVNKDVRIVNYILL